MWRLLRPHAKLFIIGVAAMVLGGVANLAEPWPIKIVLDNILRSKPAHDWLNTVILSLTGADKVALLKLTTLGILLIAILNALSGCTEKYIIASLGQFLTHDLRASLYSHIQFLPLRFDDQKRTGDLVTRLTTDVDAIQSFLTSGLLEAVTNILTLVGMMTVMLYLNRDFTLIALSVVPLLFFVVLHYTRRIKKATREVRQKESEIVSTIQEAFSSMRVIKAFARERYEESRLSEESKRSIEIALRMRGLKVRLSPMVDMIVSGGTCTVLWFGGRLALAGSLSAGSLVLLIWYLGRMYKPMRELAKMTDAYSRATVAYERIREVLDIEDEVTNLPGARSAPALRGKIEFDNVSFGYHPKHRVLKQVTLTIEPGQVVVLVGPTGAGKTTILNLIPRFYDPDSGTVKIDGTDVRLFELDSIRHQISFVLQESLLFRGPVWYNIAYGKPGASQVEIRRAAELAHAHEFIKRMPQGYDTVIGERGVTLSGGQRQRIAIARAAIRNTPILLLDEATTGLDGVSEKVVLEALKSLMQGRTSIVISHRLKTIRSADVIFLIRDGEIADRGSHLDLMQRGGLYSQLCDLELRGEDTLV
jgi:ATP-binding cassette, subfamily B, bacterial